VLLSLEHTLTERQASGTLGKYIVDELLASGKHQVTVITRTDSQATFSDGVQIARVDYDNPRTLVDAMKDQQALIITMSPTAPKDTQIKLVEAAAEAGVPYIIPNGWGFDPTHPSSEECFLGPAQRAVQKHIEELGRSSWIDFVSGPWYEYGLAGSTDRFGFDFQNKTVTFYDDGEAKINVSTWEQTARAVARVLALDEHADHDGASDLVLSSLKNKLLYHSSFLISQKDMFSSVLRVTGTAESDWTVSYESSSKRYQSGLDLLSQGNRTGFMRAMYVRAFYPEEDGFGSAAFEPTKGTYNEILALPVESLDERTKIAMQMALEQSV
jgi:hypothetical protein